MATIAVLQFIQIWDDLLVGLLFLQDPNVRPITVGLATIPGQHGLDVPLLMAGSLVSAGGARLPHLPALPHHGADDGDGEVRALGQAASRSSEWYSGANWSAGTAGL